MLPFCGRSRGGRSRGFCGKMLCVRGVPGVTGTFGKANSHFDPTQTGRGPHHHVEAAVDWCSSILLALHVHTIYDRNFALHYPKRSESIRALRTDRRSIMMIRVNVNLKSEVVEDREGKSTLCGVICCCEDRLLLSSGGSCLWPAELQPPQRVFVICFFEFLIVLIFLIMS